ncbi:GNAT family N-acetyltransferase [uncultured Maritimibacter sp.]|jgi:phosphinothricin acetyltransferase|uniref:GNAT family N-acetyltransferase n=1 Tax=uncultured Maritimibacter sp. TaxID=991866 RepID=UPI000A8CEF8A|nr:GNAT family N-acetyltransferase [uncultured Maritimibacter sp.]
MILRPAIHADLPAIRAIYAHAVTHGTASFELTPPDEAEMTRRFLALMDGGYPYLVAEDDRLLGYAYAGPYRPRPAYRSTVENSVYVSPEAKRGGVGRALLTALIEAAEAKGYRQMIAVIGDSDNVPSISLHRALGFEHVGTFKSVGYKHGRWLDSVLMQRALGSGDQTSP